METVYYFLINEKPFRAPNGEIDYKRWHILQPILQRTTNGIRVAFSRVGDSIVSTVFLGHSHGFDSTNNPILWETITLRPKLPPNIWRYSSHNEALQGHLAAVELYLGVPCEATDKEVEPLPLPELELLEIEE